MFLFALSMKIWMCFMVLYFSFHSSDCDAIKTGTFEVESKNGGKIIIHRTLHFQTETSLRTGSVNQYRISWKEDCVFLLYDRVILYGQAPITDKALLDAMDRDTICGEISDVQKNEYQVRMYSKSKPQGLAYIVKKIK